MNFYILVEGAVEKTVFREWVPIIRPGLIYVESPMDMRGDSFSILSGGGYPGYIGMIEAAVDDMEVLENCRLIVAVDSEDMSKTEKFLEIDAVIQGRARFYIDYRVTVQHFCFETWALGNRKVGPRRPKSQDLQQFKSAFDVLQEDPELLPPFGDRNRAQTALLYLRSMLRDKSPKMIYSKSDPSVVIKQDYFEQIVARHRDTGHVDSFNDFVNAFR